MFQLAKMEERPFGEIGQYEHIVTKVWSRHHQIDSPVVIELGNDIVESDKGAYRRSTWISSDLAVNAVRVSGQKYHYNTICRDRGDPAGERFG